MHIILCVHVCISHWAPSNVYYSMYIVFVHLRSINAQGVVRFHRHWLVGIKMLLPNNRLSQLNLNDEIHVCRNCATVYLTCKSNNSTHNVILMHAGELIVTQLTKAYTCPGRHVLSLRYILLHNSAQSLPPPTLKSEANEPLRKYCNVSYSLTIRTTTTILGLGCKTKQVVMCVCVPSPFFQPSPSLLCC